MAGLAALLTSVWKVYLTMPAGGQSPWHVLLPSEVEVGLQPCLQTRTSQGGGVTSPEQFPLEIKQKVNIETPMLPLDGANS